MSKEEIIKGALELEEDERARLAKNLLLSLEDMSKEELEDSWLKEVSKRASEVESDEVKLVDSEEVRAKARNLLK